MNVQSKQIDANSYLKNFCKKYCDVKECTITQRKSCCIAISLENEPAVEAVQETCGKWEYNPFFKEWECSECKCLMDLSEDENAHPNFCPNCGVNMRKKRGK